MPKLYPGYRDEIRKKIIAEALTLFLKKGVDKTTMDDIAARLGVTKPAIYRYFKNKEELFLASVQETAMGEFHEFFATSFASDDLVTGAGLFFDALLSLNRKYAAIVMDILLITQNESLRELMLEFQLEGIRTMQQFFGEQKKRGKIHTDMDLRDLALLCGALTKALSIEVTMGMDPVEAKRVWLIGFAKLAGIRTERRR
jgi:AcrR family transcriptional regulator